MCESSVCEILNHERFAVISRTRVMVTIVSWFLLHSVNRCVSPLGGGPRPFVTSYIELLCSTSLIFKKLLITLILLFHSMPKSFKAC